MKTLIKLTCMFICLLFVGNASGMEIDHKLINAKQGVDTNIYIIGGVHGDEPESVYVVARLSSWLEKNQYFNLPVVMIPVLNEHGAKNGTRTNANGVDLNRNFPTENWNKTYSKDRYNPGPEPLSEEENKFLVELFDKYPPKIIISFHSYSKAKMININGNAREVAEYIREFNQYKITDDMGYPTPGSLGTYCEEVLNVPLITYELPVTNKDLSFEEIWQENRSALEHLFSEYFAEN